METQAICCVQCGTSFLLGKGRGPRFCCQSCLCRWVQSERAKKRQSNFETWFWSNVEKSEGCWIWKLGCGHWGYGAVSVHNRTKRAHRVAWELSFGPIPKGQIVRHSCDNPPCVRPDHLIIGFPRDNSADMVARGKSLKGIDPVPPERRARGERNGAYTMPDRTRRGEKHGRAKLTKADVIHMRQLHHDGMNGKTIAAIFPQVCYTMICRILAGKAWKESI